jgi:hypothetical protein
MKSLEIAHHEIVFVLEWIVMLATGIAPESNQQSMTSGS